jgi:hypothetical protein
MGLTIEADDLGLDQFLVVGSGVVMNSRDLDHTRPRKPRKRFFFETPNSLGRSLPTLYKPGPTQEGRTLHIPGGETITHGGW